MAALISDFQHTDRIDDSSIRSTEASDNESIIDFSNLPTDYVRLVLSIQMHKMKISLFNEFNQRLLRANLDDLNYEMEDCPKYMKFKFSLR